MLAAGAKLAGLPGRNYIPDFGMSEFFRVRPFFLRRHRRLSAETGNTFGHFGFVAVGLAVLFRTAGFGFAKSFADVLVSRFGVVMCRLVNLAAMVRVNLNMISRPVLFDVLFDRVLGIAVFAFAVFLCRPRGIVMPAHFVIPEILAVFRLIHLLTLPLTAVSTVKFFDTQPVLADVHPGIMPIDEIAFRVADL